MHQRMTQHDINQIMEQDAAVDWSTGLLIQQPGCLVNFVPIPVCAGDRLRLKRDGAEFRYCFYTREIEDSLVYSYTYQPEANWSRFRPELSQREWFNRETTVEQEGFIRLVVRFVGSRPEALRLGDLFDVVTDDTSAEPSPQWITAEVEEITQTTRELRSERDAVFLLLTDTHYTTGCIWPDTVYSLRQVAQAIGPEAVIHLGDITDGLLPERHTRALAADILSDLKGICGRLYGCIGNHDLNYFRGNPGQMTKQECTELYLGREVPWYFVDLPEKKLRMLFLDSFDPTKRERYGFSRREVIWLWRVLHSTPQEYKIVVFSHVPPLPEIHVWSDTIRNGEYILRLLERFHRKRNGAVLGWIHGHNHADQICRNRSFPIIGIGCGKLEEFREHKPKGAVTYDRRLNSASQELWDVLLIKPNEKRLDFIRFGAGENRYVKSGN